MAIRKIEMQITLDDGVVVSGVIHANGDDARWGADVPHLGQCVRPMELMSCALAMDGHWEMPDAL